MKKYLIILTLVVTTTLITTVSCKKDKTYTTENNNLTEKSFLDQYYQQAYSFGKSFNFTDENDNKYIIKEVLLSDDVDYVISNAVNNTPAFFVDIDKVNNTFYFKDFEKNLDNTISLDKQSLLNDYKLNFFKLVKFESQKQSKKFWGCVTDYDDEWVFHQTCCFRFWIRFCGPWEL